jgi:hypothetical protein
LKGSEKGIFTLKDLTFTAGSGYEVLEDFNRKSLNERFNELMDMLNYASKCAFEMKHCLFHINEWKRVSDEQREEKELCLGSLAHQLQI